MNPRTNLAHRFACEENFNKIDLLIALGYDFLAAVELLSSGYKPTASVTPREPLPSRPFGVQLNARPLHGPAIGVSRSPCLSTHPMDLVGSSSPNFRQIGKCPNRGQISTVLIRPRVTIGRTPSSVRVLLRQFEAIATRFPCQRHYPPLANRRRESSGSRVSAFLLYACPGAAHRMVQRAADVAQRWLQGINLCREIFTETEPDTNPLVASSDGFT